MPDQLSRFPRINDFAFKIGTVNGTGSASANSLLMQAIFRMGIPVTGKNVFPSNIQGLPTWYEIRVSKDGYTARPGDVDLVVALNPETLRQGRRGGRDRAATCSTIRPGRSTTSCIRDGITFLGIPFGKMCVESFEGDRDRTLLRNIVYAGALAALLEIDMDVVGEMLREKFSKKKALLDANFQRHPARRTTTRRANYNCPLPFRLERMDETKDNILIDGNTAARARRRVRRRDGRRVVSDHAVDVADGSVQGVLRALPHRPGDEAAQVRVIQAEDELAAAGMVIGAGWCGARAFTSTAGPGISLMSEFIGLAYYTEIPGVFFDIQRTGPSTGMPTRTQQGDLLSIAYLSHGDTKHIALFPANPEECFYLGARGVRSGRAFSDAGVRGVGSRHRDERLDVPRFTWDDSYRPDRGKVLSADDLEQMETLLALSSTSTATALRRARCPARARKGGYFTRGSGHDEHATYTEDSPSIRRSSIGLTRKFETAANAVPAPECTSQAATARRRRSGSSRSAAVTRRCSRRSTGLRERGLSVDYMRIRAFPFPASVRAFLESHRRSSSWSSRIATASCARCSRSRPASRATACRRSSTTAACR